MNRFNYDTPTLIELIKKRPCLWDRNLNCFKNKIEKRKAWTEVFCSLEKDFLRKDKRERKRIGQLICIKWQNIRDSFVKSLKRRSYHPVSRKYIYHDNLEFLIRVIQPENIETSVQQSSNVEDEDQIKTDEESELDNVPIADDEYYPRIQKKIRLSENTDIAEVSRDRKCTPDEDEAFFISITPSVRKMSEDDKLEFRMGVLQLIKNINKGSKSTALSESTYAAVNSSSFTPSPATLKTDTEDYKVQPELFD
ncbi:hypothetical protein NQ315_005363 [Exocentrus adspersus]|uniref:MADF domain-containing protein n=1 Tax=Exocentrus adspersus TaxID=1586481 RepID=A0AAV8W1Z7_9CUCU|nr:hypothetical protein NQ315_005363 [Exocentrus adspersus]